MAEFRKWFPALAAFALMLGASATANAQPSFSCSTNAGVPPLVRAEGLAELVGDLILNCTGGTPTAANAAVPQVNIEIFLNTNITSRLLSDPWSEALLMIDEPTPGNQRYCTTNGGCAMTADGAGSNYTTGVANVFQGRQTGANRIAWLGVPIDAPGTNRTRIVRITNVRANANQLGVSSTLIPTQIVMFISVTGTNFVTINNPQQTVAFIQPGMSFSVRNITSSYLQCASTNRDASTDSSRALTTVGHVVRFTEGFASAFKIRNTAGSSSADVSNAPTAQNMPGFNYNTESGFYNPTVLSGSNNVSGLTSNIGNAGLADHGTRLHARFSNVPAGIVLYASVYGVTSSSTPAITGAFGSGSSPIRLVSTDANGGGAFSAVNATNTSLGIAMAPVSLSNGAGSAVWEVMSSNVNLVETFEAAVGVSYTANTTNNLPALGTASVAGTFAPLSTVGTASSSAPLPRFADTSAARTLFTLNACTTNILFPFVTNQLGFDTGLAISNTSVDPFGTAPQTGPCRLNYYGGTTGGGAAPAAQTSAAVPAGQQLLATLSGGGNLGIAATPGFQGYIIAQCSFQYGHGFAFISDVGANRISEAYLALILDAAISPRTGFASEVLGH